MVETPPPLRPATRERPHPRLPLPGTAPADRTERGTVYCGDVRDLLTRLSGLNLAVLSFALRSSRSGTAIASPDRAGMFPQAVPAPTGAGIGSRGHSATG